MIEQPPIVEFYVDRVFIKQMLVKKAGTLIPQHAHEYSHVSMLALGSVKVWAHDEYLGVFKAPCPIHIKAKVLHTFQALEDNTIIYCIHNVSETGEVQVYKEHTLGDVSCLGEQ